MILPRCAAVLLFCLLLARVAEGQSPPFADDERGARVAERYQTMLSANPTEGMALDRLWKMYEERGATAILIDAYRRTTDTSDKPADALIYGHLLKRAGRLDEAAGSYERAFRLDPASPLPLVAQADLATVRSQPAEAVALLEKALAIIPAPDRRRADLLMKIGEAWLAAGQPLKAGEAWEKLVSKDPGNLTLRRQLAATYEKNGLPERAILHYEYLDQHADPPGRAAALRELGRLHEIRGEFDASRDALERGLALTTRDNWLNGELQKALIRLYQRAGKAAELEARWKAAVEQAPRDLGGYLRLVALAEAQGDPAAAREWLEKVVALAPRDRENILKLARLLADAGENERAAGLYDALLKLQPSNLDLILARASLDLQLGRAADAVTRVRDRVAQNPADESVTVPALQFFLSSRLDEAALELLSADATRQPGLPEPTLALAKFLFAHGRTADAHAALDRFVRQPGDPAARAQRWIAVATCHKDAGETDEALRCWQEALALQPGSSTTLLAIAEISLAKGDLPAGTARMELAIAATPDGPARNEVEHRLFQALLDRSPPEDVAPAAPVVRPPTLSFGPSGAPIFVGPRSVAVAPRSADDPAAKSPDRPLLRYLDAMEKVARDKPSTAAYLRLAQWMEWAHRPRDAGLAADAALSLEPGNIPGREILVDTAIAQRQHGAAIRRLGEIAALDGTRKSAITKRIADLFLADGEFDGALALLERLARETPGSVEALTDLALAQQRADRWFDALATWERAYDLPRVTPAQRANLRQPMVSAYEHLGHYGRAASLLQSAIDAQDDLIVRQDLFRELVAFCRSHSLSPWLEGLYKDRLAAQPQDYFAMTSLAELQKTAGDPRAAYRLLDRAYYSSPDPAAALRTLVAEAETLGETGEAVAHQRRLVGLAGQATAENLEKLAALEESDLDDDAAARVWEQLATRFSRDTEALGAAADYFARANLVDRSRDLLARIVALDPGDFRRTYQLAQLDARAGNAPAARAGLEAILARTRPEAPGDALMLPRELDPATEPAEFMASASRSAAHAPTGTPDPATTGKDERGVRLKAIGELSRMLFADGEKGRAGERRRWLDRWHAAAGAGATSEPLAAFFYAGQKDDVANLTRSWISAPAREDPERLRKIFLLAGMRLENYSLLARWVWSANGAEGVERTTHFIEMLQYFLSTGGRPSTQMTVQLFPAETVSRAMLWQAATGIFAEKRWYSQAVELGERAVALPGGTVASEVLQLAQWELDVGRTDAARDLLRRAVAEGEGTAFDATGNNAVFADLRAYYFLLPPPERAPFVAGYLQKVQARRGSPVHARLASALLHGLEGDEAAARLDLDRIVAMRLLDGRQAGESSDLRRWNYLLACGIQLQAWHLDKLAAHVWRTGLAQASAFDKRDPEVRNVLGEIRLHQLVAEVTTATDPQETRDRIEEFFRERPSIIAMASVATVLANAGQQAAAIQIYERLRREAPAESEYSRALLAAVEATGDMVATDACLRSMVGHDVPVGDPGSRFELITRRARLAESVGDINLACRLLLDSRRTDPHSLSVLKALARMLERAKRPEDAAAIWREALAHDREVTSIEALASVESALGHRETAFALVREAKDPPSESEQAWWLGRRVDLYVAYGHAEAAVELCHGNLREGRLNGLVEAASILSVRGRWQAARDLLAEAARGTREPVWRFQFQEGIVKLLATQHDAPMEDFPRELRRLEQIASESPALRPQYESDRYNFATVRGATHWLESELRREWDDGRGEVEAGSRLVDLCIATGQWEALQTLVSAVDARPNLPEQILHSLETRLLKAGRPAWALPISERLCRRFPQNAEYTVARARVLWQSGKRDEAFRLLDDVDAKSVFRDDFSGESARLYAEFGDRARARSSLEKMTALDPLAVRSTPLYCRLAAFYMQDGRREDAERLLTIAYRNPAQADMMPLVDYLDASGKLTGNLAGELPGGELPLTFSRRVQLFAAVCERLRHSDRGAAAFQLAVAHPELVSMAPSSVGALRQDATAEQIPILAKLVEGAIRQTEFPATFLRSELAKIYVRQAELTLAHSPSRRGEATNFLTQAHELEPDNFAVARPLAVALREQHEEARAAIVLKPFLQEDALPTERAEARKILGSK